MATIKSYSDMKAKIKKTGEIIEVFKNKHNVYIDEEHRAYSAELLDFMFDEETHWQDVRERAAIAAMQGLISDTQTINALAKSAIEDNITVCEQAAIQSVKLADELVKRLKGE